MFGSPIIEVAIGPAFVYLLMSLIRSAVNENIESFPKNRATGLERGIRELFDQSGGGLPDCLKATNPPSYIPARNFAYAVLDIIPHPPAAPDVARDAAA